MQIDFGSVRTRVKAIAQTKGEREAGRRKSEGGGNGGY
jgi:hypothetical protein